jgi:hypothetical protein
MRTAVTVRFVKLAVAVIAAVNGILLTSAAPANAALAPCFNCITSPSSGTAWDSRNPVTVTGYVGSGGQTITVQAYDQDARKYFTLGTTTSLNTPDTYLPLQGPVQNAYHWHFTSPSNGGVVLANYWAPQSVTDTQGNVVPNLGSSQGHLEIRALDAGGSLIGQSTVFDPYGVGSDPEGPWVPVTGGYLTRPPDPDKNDKVAFSVGYYTVEDGKKIYGLICEPVDGPITGPYPIVIYNHGGINKVGVTIDVGSFSGTVTHGWASTNQQDALGLCVDWAMRGWIVALSTYRAESVTITSDDPSIPSGTWSSDTTEGGVSEFCLGEVTDVLALTDLLVHHASSIAVGPFPAFIFLPLNPDVGKVLMVGYSHGGCITYRAVEQGAPVTAFSVIEGVADFNLGYLNCLGSGGTKENCDVLKDLYLFGGGFGYYYPDSTGVMGYNWRSPHYFASRGDLSGPKFQTMPILIFQGDQDSIVHLDQAIELANDIHTTNFFVRPDTSVPARTITPCIKPPVGQPDPVATWCPISPPFTASDDDCTKQHVLELPLCKTVTGATGQGHYFVVYHNGDHTNWALAIKNTFNQFVESNFKKTPGCNALEDDCESG